MKIIKIDTIEITDWESFHTVSKRQLSFPEHYGENMDAWIDCVDELCDKPTLLQFNNGESLKKNNPDILKAILESCAFINLRKIELGEVPNLIISIYT